MSSPYPTGVQLNPVHVVQQTPAGTVYVGAPAGAVPQPGMVVAHSMMAYAPPQAAAAVGEEKLVIPSRLLCIIPWSELALTVGQEKIILTEHNVLFTRCSNSSMAVLATDTVKGFVTSKWTLPWWIRALISLFVGVLLAWATEQPHLIPAYAIAAFVAITLALLVLPFPWTTITVLAGLRGQYKELFSVTTSHAKAVRLRKHVDRVRGLQPLESAV